MLLVTAVKYIGY